LEACVGVSHSERSEGMGASSNGGLPNADCLLKADFFLLFSKKSKRKIFIINQLFSEIRVVLV
jgi:hypothetical protein